MNRHHYLTITAVLLASAGGLTGCGDAGDTLTAAEFTEQANAICINGDEKIGEVLGPIFSGDPSPEELQGALDGIVSTSRDTSDRLARLAPPSEIADQVDDMVVAFNAANDEAEAQGIGFFEGDDDPWAPLNVMAEKLGLADCVSD